MKLKQKILLSVSLLVFISLITLFLTGNLVIRLFSSQFDPKELVVAEPYVFEAGEILKEALNGEESWEAAGRKLEALGYRMAVGTDDTIIWTSGETKTNVFSSALPFSWKEEELLLYRQKGWSILGIRNGEYTLLAAGMPEGPGTLLEDQSEPFTSMRLTYFVVGILSILIILLVSMIYTRFQAKAILKPVKALEEGARRVEQGDLLVPVLYEGKDEFSTVCGAFNRMQDALRREQEKNRAYEKARSDMVNGISHDLRTPLTFIKGSIKGILDGVAATPQKQEQYLTIAYRKTCEMDGLLQKLLSVSRMEAGSIPLLIKERDLGEFVRNFAEESEAEWKNSGIISRIQVAAGPHPVNMDEEQLRRVLWNLSDNAMKYAASDPLTFTIQVYSGTEGEHLVFSDNGAGVREEDLPRLFEQFWRGDVSRSPKNGEGNGLGLAIAKQIIEAHGGQITAYNREGLAVEMIFPSGKESHA